MSKRANPTAVGAFVLGSFLVAILLIVYFGSLKFFAKEECFILYFQNSANGLDVGAPVKFKGVRVGSVKEIRIHSFGAAKSLASRAYIPVVVSLDEALIQKEGIMKDFTDPELLKKHIEAGLRGQMELDSLISGKLFIELDYDRNSPLKLVQESGPYQEIPTRLSTIDEAGETASQVFSDLRTIDIAYMYTEFMNLIENLNAKVDALDFSKMQNSFTDAADSVAVLAQSNELNEAIRNFKSASQKADKLLSTLDESMDAERIQAMMVKLDDTLDQLNGAAAELNNKMAPDSELSVELQNNLRMLRNTLQSANSLLEFLERHPNAILSGRSEENTATSQRN